MRRHLKPTSIAALGLAVTSFFCAGSVSANIRIANYNVNADTDRNGDKNIDALDATYGIDQIAHAIEAMGTYDLAGNKQPVDAIALQELYALPLTTVTPLLQRLNTYYQANIYAFITPANSGNSTLVGNGPSGLIYNTTTIQITNPTTDAVTVGSLSSQGEARYPLRFKLKAVKEKGNNEFYLYTVHSKAGTASAASNGTTNGMRRTYEDDAMRADADSLGASAHIIYSGDFNFTAGSNEGGYIDLKAPAGTTLTTNGNPASSAAKIVAGAARAFDPITNTFSSSVSDHVEYYTEAANDLFSRDDLQLLTANTMPFATSPGLQLLPKTYTAFGNSYYDSGGTLKTVNELYDSIDSSTNAAQTKIDQGVLKEMVYATDHLPVLAEYAITPEPTTFALVATSLATIRRRRR